MIWKIVFLSVTLIVFNTVVYLFAVQQNNTMIDKLMVDKMKVTKTHYDILLLSQKGISTAIFKSIIRNLDIIELLDNSYKKSDKIQTTNRNEMQKQLFLQYESAKTQGILQIHLVDRDNNSFLRMHKVSKFGDNLTLVRDDFRIVNETHKIVRGFGQGRTAHGFRNSFPIFNKTDEYIGAMEISFSSDNLEHYLNEISNIHTHFLVSLHTFKAKSWERDDLILKYNISPENKNFYLLLLMKTIF